MKHRRLNNNGVPICPDICNKQFCITFIQWHTILIPVHIESYVWHTMPVAGIKTYNN